MKIKTQLLLQLVQQYTYEEISDLVVKHWFDDYGKAEEEEEECESQ